jgi:hypothetical protein
MKEGAERERYLVLRILAFIYTVVAALGLISSVFLVLNSKTESYGPIVVVLFVGTIMGSLMCAGAAEVLKLFMDVEDSARRSASALEAIQQSLAEQTKK